MRSFRGVGYRRLFIVLAASLVAAAGTLVALAATQTDIPGPAGSGSFGRQVVVLTNGNIVVTDPGYDAPGPLTDVGAVYLYDGATGTIISRLTGSAANDQVGGGGVVTLTNGNYVVRSPVWDNGAITDVGAITWGSGTTGVTGTVSAANSLVGSAASEMLGNSTIVRLTNGNYVVRSPFWKNGAVQAAGAVTFGNGATGISGTVSSSNSLVGSSTFDQVGYAGVVALSNGHYVVRSPDWDNGSLVDVGAATWGNGTIGITGVVSVANSLIGGVASDMISYSGITALSNGHYVVSSSYWDNGLLRDAGAVTWGNGTTGITGFVSATNSLVGDSENAYVGEYGAAALRNGNYVVDSPSWNYGSLSGAGAATWGNGTTGITGVVSITNSLVGSTASDFVGEGGIVALSNGNYVVNSHNWINSGVQDVGAVTWGSGTTGITGTVSAANSLVGSVTNDRVGVGSVIALANGNYVVSSPWWDNGAAVNAGAATWGNGATGITGPVSTTNSLVGTIGAQVSYSNSGGDGVTALTNGNYVVSTPWWNNDAGAVTWGNGVTGITGVVSAANSLVGSIAEDYVGYNPLTGPDITALSNGNYVVASPLWNSDTITDAGAVTWVNGSTGMIGVVSSTNSLVGSLVDDRVGHSFSGQGGVKALANGHYAVHSPLWDNGAVVDAGAVTWGNGYSGVVGSITADNSVRGTTVGEGWSLNFDFDAIHLQLVVGRPADNIVTLYRLISYQVYLPLIRK